MSADLFADFNKPPQDAAKQPASSVPQPAKSDPFDSLFGAAPSNSASFSQWNIPQAPVQAQKQSTGWDNSAWNSKQQGSATPIATTTADEDDDGWGDFEVAESTQPVAPQAPPMSSLSDFSSFSQPAPAQAQPLGWGAPQTQPKPQQPTFSSDFQDFGLERIQDEEYQQEKHPKLKVKSNAHDPNVLFDVDDFELGGGEGDEEDDFGNFESTAPPPAPTYTKPVQNTARMAPPVSQPPSMDLLSLDDPEPSPPSPEPQTDLRFGALNRTAPTSNSTSRHASKPSFGMTSTSTTTSQRAKSPVKTTAPIQKKATPATTSFDDDWGAWDDAPAKEAPKIAHEATNATSSWDWEADATPPAPASGNELPPVNVPPPSILLSLFPELFNLGEPLFQSLSGQTAEAKKKILSNGKTVDFVKGYVLLASTAARVIAGRKQRWHRDKILAKSMSISAAGSKGMKLAGVDKTQSAREDREAADVVTAWKQHVGRLRSAVAVVNAAGGIPVKVPELSESIKIQTAKNVPTAAKPCVICGLKRDERLLNVDVDVEDSFGEWWTEHWGHRACKNFWLEHEKSLRQR